MAVAGYIGKTTPLPNLRAQQVGREVIGDRARTAGGTMRRDFVAAKRTWELELVYLTQSEYSAIVTVLTTANWGAVDFWLDELGGTASANSIKCYVDITGDDRVQFRGTGGTWVDDGRNLKLAVVEQ